MTPLFSTALLVEDELHLAAALEIALRKLGISCRVAHNITKARELLSDYAPELMILDRMLPDGDGLELCKELRNKNYNGPILILTAVSEVADRVAGLDTGADDYLAKPFSWTELEARIRALSRRKGAFTVAQSEPRPRAWTLDQDRLRVLGPKGWIELTPLEFKLASRLITRKGSIVSRDDLLMNVWGFKLLPKTRTVDYFLSRLRKHFEHNPEEPRHFVTVRGAGYRFEA